MAPLTVIHDSLNIVRSFAKEFRSRGLTRATKPLGGYDSVRARVVAQEERFLSCGKRVKPNSIIYSVERTAPHKADKTSMVLARDTFVSSASGKPKLVESQLMSETGEAIILPSKKGFLGIGKRKGSITVAQSSERAKILKNDNTAENMYLTAQGTLQEPVNPVLNIGDNKFVLTLEKAKQFINDVLQGKKAYGFQYKP